MIRHTLLASALLVAVAACSGPDAPTTPATPRAVIGAEQPAAAVVADAKPFVFDQGSSRVGFVGAKVTGHHGGTFPTFNGQVLMGPSEEASAVTVTIDMASVTSDNEKLTGHLRSADFFDAATFKTTTFTSTSVKKGGEGGATHTVSGNLALHGVTKNITFPATITTTPELVTVKAAFAFDRKAFNITYPGKADDLQHPGDALSAVHRVVPAQQQR
jgi:polyisoprenoid-binding protein YceI